MGWIDALVFAWTINSESFSPLSNCIFFHLKKISILWLNFLNRNKKNHYFFLLYNGKFNFAQIFMTQCFTKTFVNQSKILLQFTSTHLLLVYKSYLRLWNLYLWPYPEWILIDVLHSSMQICHLRWSMLLYILLLAFSSLEKASNNVYNP